MGNCASQKREKVIKGKIQESIVLSRRQNTLVLIIERPIDQVLLDHAEVQSVESSMNEQENQRHQQGQEFQANDQHQEHEQYQEHLQHEESQESQEEHERLHKNLETHQIQGKSEEESSYSSHEEVQNVELDDKQKEENDYDFDTINQLNTGPQDEELQEINEETITLPNQTQNFFVGGYQVLKQRNFNDQNPQIYNKRKQRLFINCDQANQENFQVVFSKSQRKL